MALARSTLFPNGGMMALPDLRTRRSKQILVTARNPPPYVWRWPD